MSAKLSQYTKRKKRFITFWSTSGEVFYWQIELASLQALIVKAGFLLVSELLLPWLRLL